MHFMNTWDIDEKAIAVHTRAALQGFKSVGYKVEVLIECPTSCPGDSRGCATSTNAKRR